MADKPIKTPLPGDLPEDWKLEQIVSPGGTEAGLTEKHGYNYLMAQINAAQRAVNAINEAFPWLAGLGEDGRVPADQLPSLDYVPNAEKGAANGVATLGPDGKVPEVQIPSLGYIPTSQKGAANGVASLGANKKIPSAQLPPPFVAQTTAPSDTRVFWVDTANGSIIKYHNGSAWVAVAGVWG